MANPVLSCRDFIQKSFSPFIAVLSSSLVDEICQKNHLSFIELLEPFCLMHKDVCYKDPGSNIVTIKNLQIVLCDVNLKPPEAAVARRLLNESVSAASDENVEYVRTNSGNISVDIPATVPWFENWKTTFLKVQFPSDHEFTKHYIACMIVITSQDDNPMDTLSNKVQQFQQMLSMSPPKMIPKWFSSSVLRYYILLHDVVSGDLKKAEKVYEEMKSTYSANCCYMLQINSNAKGVSANEFSSYWRKFAQENDDIRNVNIGKVTDSVVGRSSESAKVEIGLEISEQSNPEMITHPLSPHLEIQQNIISQNVNGLTDETDNLQNVELCLSREDTDNVKALVSNFVVNALIPFVETQMQYLNEMVFNKKVPGKSIFGMPKRWFGGPKPGSPVSAPNAHYYHPDSPELQMRRLGDLCFLFGAYTTAFQAYHSVKRDFSNDGAWLYYAGALEMAALSAFLIGQDIKKALEYTEESIITYLQTCRMPQFATRLTLCATECLKSLNMFGEAAGRLLLMTSEDSDLRSALLLEEASYCFIKSRKPPMPRKYAFHLVLAGHRFAKASQKKHSLRCYRQAYQVYKDKNWSLAEDHIHFTIGKLASSLKQKQVTAAELAQLFKKPSTQLPVQQVTFLKEYFLSLIALENEREGKFPFLEIPHVNHSSIKVALNMHQNENPPNGYVLAGKQMSEKELSDTRWWKLEESLVSFSNNSSAPFFFKPSVNIFSNSTNNSIKPTCVIEEQIRISVDLINILNVPLSLRNVELMWIHSSQSDSSIANVQAETEVLDSVSLTPDSNLKVSLHITPKTAGVLHITGIVYSVVLQPTSDSNDSVSIYGHTLLSPQGMRVITTKDQKTAPVYLPDYRLQLVAVNDAPRLKIYFKNLPSEMLCGEVKEIRVVLQNVGTLPINSVLFNSSKPNSFSVPSCVAKCNVFSLLRDPIQPGHSVEVTIFVRGCDKSGRLSIDLLFSYNTDRSSQRKMKYRLIYHTLHLLIHESLFASASVSRSIKLNDDSEGLNIRLQAQNKNQIYDPIKFTIFLNQISLYSSHWQIYNVIFSTEEAISLEQEQVVFLTLKARRTNDCDLYSDVTLSTAEEKGIVNDQFKDFTQYVIQDKVLKIDDVPLNANSSIASQKAASAISLNSILILFWKAEVKNVDTTIVIFGQHYLPILNLGQTYTTLETSSTIEAHNSFDSKSIFIPPSISELYCANTDVKDLLLVKMKHPAFVTHCFLENRICSVDVELVLQNCCDIPIEIKLDATNQTNNTVNKINESSAFLWMGLVLSTLLVDEHSYIIVPLSVCVGNTGTYDLASQLSISARKSSTDVFVHQSGISHSLLCVSANVL